MKPVFSYSIPQTVCWNNVHMVAKFDVCSSQWKAYFLQDSFTVLFYLFLRIVFLMSRQHEFTSNIFYKPQSYAVCKSPVFFIMPMENNDPKFIS